MTGRRGRKSRKAKKKSLGMLILVLAALSGNIFLNDTVSIKVPEAEQVYAETEDTGELEVHFIDVGQGDATLIFLRDHAMLIDGGENNRGWQIVDYLNYLGIEHLDYVIGTHPDSDHIGGLDTVIENISCNIVMMPELERDTASYEGIVQAVEEQGVKSISPKPGETYELGNAIFTILAPNDTYDNINDNSIALRLVHGDNSFLFTGDAEEEAEDDMLKSGRELASDVYKAAHHGSSGANSELFLMVVKPTYAVISCGENNEYGHPHSEVLNRLRMLGTEVYRTDEQGTIVAVSDGSEISFNMSSTDSWQSGQNF